MNKYLEKLKSFDIRKMDSIAPLLFAVLILYLAWKLASIVWLVIAPPQVMQFERVELGSQKKQIPNITSFALFPEANMTSNDANLAMSLQGVVVSSPSHMSSAVIKVNDYADRYKVGDVVDSTSFQLAEVYWDKVILRHSNGSTRELSFTGIENGLDQPIVPPENSANTSGNNANNGSSQTENAISQAMQKMQQDKEQYLKEMGVNSSSAGGYVVTENTPSALKSKLGLQAGDRILSLNGQAVGNGQTDVDLLGQAKREGQVKIEIKRGDQVMTVQQDFR